MECKYMSDEEIKIKKMSNMESVKFYHLGELNGLEIMGLMVFYTTEDNKLGTLNYASNEKMFPYLVRQVMECYKREKRESVISDSLTRDILTNGLKLDYMIDERHFNNNLYETKVFPNNDFNDIKQILYGELKNIFSLIGDEVSFEKINGYQNHFAIDIIRNNQKNTIYGIIINKDDFEYQVCLKNVFEFPLYINIFFNTDYLKINWNCPNRNVFCYVDYIFFDKDVSYERELYIDGQLSFFDEKKLNYQDLKELKPLVDVNGNNIGTIGIMIFPEVFVFIKRELDGVMNLKRTSYLLKDKDSSLIKESGYRDYIGDNVTIKMNEYMMNTRIFKFLEYGIVEYYYNPCVLSNGRYKGLERKSGYSIFYSDKKLNDIKEFKLEALNNVNMMYDDVYDVKIYKKEVGK